MFNFDPRLPSAKELIILDMLAGKKEMYGLEMVQASGGKLARGTIYVTLMRMDDKGYVTSRQLMEENVSGLAEAGVLNHRAGAAGVSCVKISASGI